VFANFARPGRFADRASLLTTSVGEFGLRQRFVWQKIGTSDQARLVHVCGDANGTAAAPANSPFARAIKRNFQNHQPVCPGDIIRQVVAEREVSGYVSIRFHRNSRTGLRFFFVVYQCWVTLLPTFFLFFELCRAICIVVLHQYRANRFEPPISAVITYGLQRRSGTVSSVRLLLQLNYPEFEIVIVNDGSKINARGSANRIRACPTSPKLFP